MLMIEIAWKGVARAAIPFAATRLTPRGTINRGVADPMSALSAANFQSTNVTLQRRAS
jgi:hypothetical protein